MQNNFGNILISGLKCLREQKIDLFFNNLCELKTYKIFSNDLQSLTKV